MIFDTHTHYYDEAFGADRDALLTSPPGRGVALVVCPGCDLEFSRQSITLVERYGFLYTAAGYHPGSLEGTALSGLDTVKTLCTRPKVVAVEGIGLNYYWLRAPEERASSQDFFDARLSLAEGLNLPTVVHNRGAHRSCLDIVCAHPGICGVFHCYSGSLEDAKVLMDKDRTLSFTGNITSRNTRRTLNILRWLPLDRLMLEADTSYVAPRPRQGQRRDSTIIARSAGTAAQLRGLTQDEVGAVTLENGKKFFGIA